MRLTKEQWKQAEKDFVVNNFSYGQLETKYNITKGAIFKKGKNDSWNEKREIYNNKKKNKVVEKYNEKLEKVNGDIEKVNDEYAEEWANFDIKCLKLVNKALDVCNDDLDTLIQFKKDFDNLPYEIRMRLSKHTTVELNQLSSAIEKYQKIGKNAVGEKMQNNDSVHIKIIEIPGGM